MAAVLLGLLAGLCFITGGVWDVAWHIDRGRETFWSPPHLAIYGGLLLGVAMPFVALWRDDGAGPTVRVLGRRLSPAALVGGVGALLAIGAGPFDEAWHQMFGLDVTIWSPPHLQLVVGATATVLGAVIELAARVRRAGAGAPEWHRLALALGFGLLLNMGIAPLGEYQFGLSRFPVYWHPILVPLAVVPILAAAARVQEPWGATRAAVAFQLVGLMMWLVLIQVGRSATFAALMPIAAAVAYDLLLRARRLRPELAGAAATLVLLYTQADFMRPAALVVWPLGRLPWIVVVAVLLGAAGAALGDRVGLALRPRGEGSTAARRRLPLGALSAAAAGVVLLAVLPSVAAADNMVRLTRGVGALSSSPMAEVIQAAGTGLVVVTVLIVAGGAALALRAVEREPTAGSA